MSRINVLHVITGLTIGGAEMMLFNLLSRTDRERFDSAVISLMGRAELGEAIEKLGVPVHTLNLLAGVPTPQGLLKLLRLARATSPDVIQGWMYHGNLAAQAASAAPGCKAPVFWCVQNSFRSFAAEKKMTAALIKLSARISARPSKVVHVSSVSRAQHEEIGFCRDNSCVIPNGVDLETFAPSPEARASVRAELRLPDDAALIGLAARYHAQKDHACFLRAAALFRKSCPQAYFLLVGHGIDAGNRALTNLIDELGIADRVLLLGERRDMARITASLDIATSSSSYGEGLSLAIAEAMSCGVPCVVTDVGDSAILVGKTGVAVPPGDPQALANAWARLLAAGGDVRKELGSAARERVRQHYSIGEIVRRYEELYAAGRGD